MEKKLRLSLVLPLLGVTVAWIALVVSSFLETQRNAYGLYQYQMVKPSTYIVLVGLGVGALLCLWAFRHADARHVSDTSALARAEYRFSGLMIVLSLASLVVFAFVTFIGSLTSSFSAVGPTVTDRIFGTYIPIVLAAAVVVFVLLQAMLYRKTAPVDGAESKGMSATQNALAIGYAVPIFGTAFAIILGLVVFDANGQKLESWTWVVIMLIIGVSIYFGTRFAAKAKAAKPVKKPVRVVGAAGAMTLNYVLSVVFAGVVGIMSFGFGTGAVAKLASNTVCDDMGNCTDKVLAMDATWWLNDMGPSIALLLVVEVATYLVIVARNKPAISA